MAKRVTIPVDLDDDLARQARHYTNDLSNTVETLLVEFVARASVRDRSEDDELGAVMDAFALLHQRYGLLSDEFSAL